MENIKEIISQLFQSPEMTALVSAAFAYLTANLGTIIIFACKMIKAKNNEIKQKDQSDAVIEELTAEYNAKVELLANNIELRKRFSTKSKVNSLEFSEENIAKKWKQLLEKI